MRTVYHPTLAVTRKVESDAVESWREAGWRVTKPRHFTDSPAADAADQGQHSDDEGDN
jgi:hypothetical protein